MNIHRGFLLVPTLFLLSACGGADDVETGATSDPTTDTTASAVEGGQVALVSGFSGPESVRYDEEADVYFIGNFNGNPSELANNGFISRMTPDGEIEELHFIAGGQNGATLHAARGMGL